MGDSLGDDGHLNGLLAGKREPVSNLRVKRALAGERVRRVQQGAGGGDDHAVLAERLDCCLHQLNAPLHVILPDVAAVHDARRQDLVGSEVLQNLLELLWVAHQVHVQRMGVLQGAVDNVQVVHDVAKVRGQHEVWSARGLKRGQLPVCAHKSLLDGLREVKDQHGLVNLDGFGAGCLQLFKQLNVDWQQLIQERDRLNCGIPVCLSEHKERDWAENNRPGGDASLLCLEEVDQWLGIL
mmetsp:Transcript_27133/g.80495  ORF Transcript_27133/g.80495 Transcript_27133/m.80495 type:complete len:239 (+) Transcript_27133:2028-2744(+)